jgi:hypothetical protein
MNYRQSLYVLVLGALLGASMRGARAEDPPASRRSPFLLPPGLPATDDPDRRGLDPLTPNPNHEPAAEPDAWQTPSGLKASFLRKYGDQNNALTGKLDVQDTGTLPSSPFLTNKWQAEDELRMSVTGPLFVFSQVGAGCDATDNQLVKLQGKTGLACKLEGWSRFEVLLRGGPMVSSVDALRPLRRKDESELMLELQCRCPVAGKIKVEYDGSAIPALSVTERDRLKQDLRLAVPLGALGKFSVGARHSWEETTTARPWTDGMQLYIGVDLKR